MVHTIANPILDKAMGVLYLDLLLKFIKEVWRVKKIKNLIESK
jgi:hypothetical protein